MSKVMRPQRRREIGGQSLPESVDLSRGPFSGSLLMVPLKTLKAHNFMTKGCRVDLEAVPSCTQYTLQNKPNMTHLLLLIRKLHNLIVSLPPRRYICGG